MNDECCAALAQKVSSPAPSLFAVGGNMYLQFFLFIHRFARAFPTTVCIGNVPNSVSGLRKKKVGLIIAIL